MKKIIPILLALCSIVACENNNQLPKSYHTDWNEWRTERDVKLRAESGFVNLVGLYWLKEGENTIGSSKNNSIPFPTAAPSNIGSVFLKDSVVVFECAADQEIVIDSFCLNGGVIYDKKEGVQSIQSDGRFEWYIIERAGNLGVRLRDLAHPKTKTPLNLEYYNPSKEWQIEAVFKKFEQEKNVQVDNIVGFSFNEKFEGELVFEIAGKEYSLLPSKSADNLFIMFSDETNGLETYGSGRYLTTALPDENGRVIIDFNKAYNPPCAFTAFATCPLPISENHLNLKVEAGEKDWH